MPRKGPSPNGSSADATGVENGSPDSLRALIRRYRELNDRRSADVAPPIVSGNERQTKISIIAWDMAHNALGRAYLLADLLRSEYAVEIVGAIFPRVGTELWAPLRSCNRVTMKYFYGADFPEQFSRMKEIAEQIDGDIIYVSKPKLPSIELAILATLHRNRPIVLDIDDYEIGLFKKTDLSTPEDVKEKKRKLNQHRPQTEIWTRYCESLIPLFDQITVSNEELQKKYGGVVLPHVRCEHDFNPGVYPRNEIRATLGFGSEDRVILFAGTLRMHKGLSGIVPAVELSRRLNCKLLVVGTAPDADTREFLDSLDTASVRVLPDVPFHDLPGYLCAGDLVCLLQDPNSLTSLFQMPAKFTDALAMGIPVLASNAPPLRNLARDGLVELLGSTPLETKIREMLLDYGAYRERARANRKVFLSRYSYGACRPWMKAMIDRLLETPSPTPIAFRDLIDNHRRLFSTIDESQTRRKVALTVQQPVGILERGTA